MRYSSRLAFVFALLSSAALAQQVNDVQLRPGSSALWGATFNANNNQVIDQLNTAGSVVDSFRWYQGSSVAQGTQLFSVSPTGTVVGSATGGRMGAGTINATGIFQNGVAFGGTPAGTNGQIQYNNAGAFGGFTTSGDATINTSSGALTLATVNGNVGTWGSATLCSAFTVNAKGLITGAANSACTPAIANVTGLGTGIAAALAINTGSAGAPVLFNGAGGTPTSLVGTNITGTAAGLTAGTASAVAVGGITGLGSGVATWLATPSSANLATAVTGETGTGALVFATSPTLVTPALGTPASGVITNLTGTCTGCTANTFTAGSATNLTSGTLPAARTNGHQNGTATNDSAAAGEIGEYMSNAANPALTTAVSANCGQITLTAGDWDVYASAIFGGAGATVTSDVRLGISTTSATLPTSVPFAFFEFRNGAGITDFFYAPTVGPLRASINTNTTYFCVAQATFTTSTFSAQGTIIARRRR